MSINKIIIENFKIFEGQHIFDLNELNIFTGANNSGKSTLFKAIALFAKGLEKGDFPTMDLFEDNVGEFKDLVNRKSNADYFKIGFYIELGKKKTPFKLLYKFVKGDDDEAEGTAQFANFEVFDLKGDLLFGVYDIYKYDVNDYNIEYEKLENHTASYGFPFQTPSENGEPGILIIKFNIDTLENHILEFTSTGFSKLISQMKHIRGKHNNWWGEQFHEANFGYDLSQFSLEDLLRDISIDEFCNIGDFKTKDSIYWDKDDSKHCWDEYVKLKKRIGYSDFLKEIILPLFNSIDSGLDFFRTKNIAHVVFQNFEDRLIKKNSINQYLFSIYKNGFDSWEFNNFVRESLKIFNIDGYIEIISHINSALEVNLVSGLKTIDFEIEKEFDIDSPSSFTFTGFEGKYKKASRQNIQDLGKGTANLIGLILKTYSVLAEQKKRKKKNEEVRKSLGYEPIMVLDKFILVEEPEVFLHPDWQSKLADFFVHCIKYGNLHGIEYRRFRVKFLIETHSVYLIQRLQYLVAKNEIEPEDINTVFFNADDKKEKFYKMKMRKDGIFVNKFGTGFYDETSKLTLNILNPHNKN